MKTMSRRKEEVRFKSRRELELMRAAGRVTHRCLQRAIAAAKAGVTTGELDNIITETYRSAGGVSVFKWYPTYQTNKGFPGNTCISINEEIVHGIPGGRQLKDGDIVKVDCGVKLGGYIGDSAVSILIGNVAPEVQKLSDVTREALNIAIREARPGRRWSDVAKKMQDYVEKENGMSCVRDFVGHGVGTDLHEEPKVPNFVDEEFLRKRDFYLQPGMTIAVEPMVCLGTHEFVMLDDGWTIVTKDNKAAAHWEHTLAITPTGCEILTDGN
jgi:methionyl aminopeptidase